MATLKTTCYRTGGSYWRHAGIGVTWNEDGTIYELRSAEMQRSADEVSKTTVADVGDVFSLSDYNNEYC